MSIKRLQPTAAGVIMSRRGSFAAVTPSDSKTDLEKNGRHNIRANRDAPSRPRQPSGGVTGSGRVVRASRTGDFRRPRDQPGRLHGHVPGQSEGHRLPGPDHGRDGCGGAGPVRAATARSGAAVQPWRRHLLGRRARSVLGAYLSLERLPARRATRGTVVDGHICTTSWTMSRSQPPWWRSRPSHCGLC